jgi:hypothetical protein
VEEVDRFPLGRGIDYDLGGRLLFVFFTSAIAGFANKFANSGFAKRSSPAQYTGTYIGLSVDHTIDSVDFIVRR